MLQLYCCLTQYWEQARSLPTGTPHTRARPMMHSSSGNWSSTWTKVKKLAMTIEHNITTTHTILLQDVYADLWFGGRLEIWRKNIDYALSMCNGLRKKYCVDNIHYYWLFVVPWRMLLLKLHNSLVTHRPLVNTVIICHVCFSVIRF